MKGNTFFVTICTITEEFVFLVKEIEEENKEKEKFKIKQSEKVSFMISFWKKFN